MKLKFWKKEEIEPIIVEIKEEYIEKIIELMSIYEQKWDDYAMKLVKENSIDEFPFISYTNKAMRYERYLLWEEIAKFVEEVKDNRYSFELKFHNKLIYYPYFKGTPV